MVIFLLAASDDLLRGERVPDASVEERFARGWTPSTITKADCQTWNSIAPGGSWLFAPLSGVQSMQTGTTGLEQDLLVLSRFFDSMASTGRAATEQWPKVDMSVVSVAFDGPAAKRIPRAQNKPARVAQFLRAFPAKWQAAVHSAAAKEFFQEWYNRTAKKDVSHTMRLFFQWLQDRMEGPIRCVGLLHVSDVPLVFRDGSGFRCQDLPPEQVPVRPDGRFCYQWELKGLFFTTDFELPQTVAEDPTQVTLRYHGTNLYALSFALATGMLAGAPTMAHEQHRQQWLSLRLPHMNRSLVSKLRV